MKPTPEEVEKFDHENESDVDQWEVGDLGKNPQYIRKMNSQNSQELHRKIVTGLRQKTRSITVRLPTGLIDDLKAQAIDDGLPYQTLIRMILLRHVKGRQQDDSPG